MSRTSYNFGKRKVNNVIQPISYYKFNGNVNDSKGVNNGTANNITYTNGILGTANEAIQLGANKFVSLNSKTIVGGRESFSVVILFKSGGGTSNNALYGSWGSPQKILIRIHSGGALQCYVNNGTTTKGGNIGLGITDTNWHVAILTYGVGGLKGYIDKNTNIHSNPDYIGALSTTGDDETIGKFGASYGDSTIEVLAIYPNKFTQEEVNWATDKLLIGQDLI